MKKNIMLIPEIIGKIKFRFGSQPVLFYSFLILSVSSSGWPLKELWLWLIAVALSLPAMFYFHLHTYFLVHMVAC